MDSQTSSNASRFIDEGQRLPQGFAEWPERERVLEAMVRIAAAKSYDATTVADVVEMAGVSREAFEEMFQGKADCFLEAYDRVVDVLIAYVSNTYAATAGQPWPERVAAGLRALVGLLSAEADIVRMAMVEVTAAGEKARERYRAALARFTPLLEEGRRYSGRDEDLPSDTAAFAVGGATSMIFDEVRAGRGAELKAILPALVFAVLMPYLGPEEAEKEMRRVAREG
jgi:AcrR family transcriptional regulator